MHTSSSFRPHTYTHTPFEDCELTGLKVKVDIADVSICAHSVQLCGALCDKDDAVVRLSGLTMPVATLDEWPLYV